MDLPPGGFSGKRISGEWIFKEGERYESAVQWLSGNARVTDPATF
jgi:hypothetical protein